MRCDAILFNLESIPSKNKSGVNHFLTFVDEDSGESFRTFIGPELVPFYARLKPVSMVVSLSLGTYNGAPQMNCRVLSISERASVQEPPKEEPRPEAVPASVKPASLFPKTGTAG